MNLHDKYKSKFDEFQIDTPLRLAHFFAQLEHESGGLKPISENLNYSAKGLATTFRKYFPTPADTLRYEHQPELIANKVYANRMGNGSEATGDGFKYRGRGFFQTTGKSNYADLKNHFEVDYINYPELLLNEADAILSALYFWVTRNLSKYADQDDIVGLTKKINGGTNGLDDRKKLLIKYKTIFNV